MEGSEFYEKYLRAGKEAGLSNFLSRCLKRINFSSRKNSISQVVPDTWRADAETASAEIRDAFKDCDVIVNADQTFVKMYLEDEKVLAPVGTKRVGGKVNAADKKAGFTVMIAAEMTSNKVCDPFITFAGTKMKDSTRPRATLDYKFVPARMFHLLACLIDGVFTSIYFHLVVDINRGKQMVLVAQRR